MSLLGDDAVRMPVALPLPFAGASFDSDAAGLSSSDALPPVGGTVAANGLAADGQGLPEGIHVWQERR